MLGRKIGQRLAWCAAAVLGAMGLCSPASAQQVVISQIYGAGGNTGANFNADYIVLKNRTAAAVSLATWSIQYASETGTSWTRFNLTGSIPANGYYLIRTTTPGGVGAALPTPDASTTTIAMSATAGKVALVSNQTTLLAQAGFTPYTNGIVDFVGFSQNTTAAPASKTGWYEGSGPTPPVNGSPALTATQAVQRLNSGDQDTDNNAADFSVITANPLNSASPTFTGTATGACCLTGGACVVTDATNCATLSGTYGGDFTACGAVSYSNASSANTLEDISGTGTNLTTLNASDDGNAQVTLPWNFPWFGTTRDRLVVNVNGIVYFAPGAVGTFFTPAAIPTVGTPNDFIAPLWFDQHTRTAGRIYTEARTSPDRYIVQWNNVSTQASSTVTPDSLTYQVILFRDGSIEYRYGTFTTTGTTPTSFSAGTTARVGVENQGGTAGNAFAYAPNALTLANTARLFTMSAATNCVPQPPSITATNVSPVGPKVNGDSVLMTVTVLPGTIPMSTGMVVTGNLTAIGGGAMDLFTDDGPMGMNGDLVAGDNIFSRTVTISGATPGTASLPVTVTDQLMRTGTGTLTVFIAQDLGVYTTTTTTNLNVNLAVGQIRWFKFVIPDVLNVANNWLDITTNVGTLAGFSDIEIATYNPAGTKLTEDDDDGPGNFSEVSYGFVPGTARATLPTAVGGNGRDGTLASGTYYLAVVGFNATFSNGFLITTSSTATGDVAIRFDLSVPGAPTNPTGAGSASPSTVTNCGTASTTLTVVVTPGMFPDSTAHTVTADLTSIGGMAGVMLTEGPANTFTVMHTVPNTVTAGLKSVPFTVQETAPNARSSMGSLGVTVINCPPVNDVCGGAFAVMAGSTNFNTTDATTDTTVTCATSGKDLWYTYTPTCTGNVTISTCNATGFDTVLTAFASCGGAELACNDDDATCVNSSLRSKIVVSGTAGVPFFIRVAGFGSSPASGAGVMTITETVVAPAITTQPSGGKVCVGAMFSFTVAASGSPLNYQWRKDGMDIMGATAATYTIAAAVTGDSGSYDCVVSNTCGSTTSSAALFEVNVATAVTADPSNAKICEGANHTFSVSAVGKNLTYQWRKGGVDIMGATATTYMVSNAGAGDAGNYDVVVNGDCGSATSAAAVLEVNQTTAVTMDPTGAKICFGGMHTLSVGAVGKNLTYQWRVDGSDIMGATGSSYMTGAGGSYDCVVSGDCGSATSAAAIVEVNPTTAVTMDPSGGAVCEGQPFTFSVGAVGKNLTYQWRKNGNDIMGATASSYMIASVAGSDAGTYDVVVNGDCGSATSAGAALSVNTAPAVTMDPSSATICDGDAASFTVAASGTPAPTYQWRKNGVDIMGATGATYNIPAAGTGDAGSYDCVVTNVCGTATSAAATLTVNVGPTITTQPSNQSVAQGGSATFTVVASGTAPISYQWRKNTVNLSNGGSIMGATSDTLSIAPVALADGGSYDVIVSNACGSVTSSSATLTVTGCVADVDDGSFTGTPDGGVTIDDLLYYLYIFENGFPSADVDDGSFTGTLDGGVTIDDLLYFLFRFENGC